MANTINIVIKNVEIEPRNQSQTQVEAATLTALTDLVRDPYITLGVHHSTYDWYTDTLEVQVAAA